MRRPAPRESASICHQRAPARVRFRLARHHGDHRVGRPRPAISMTNMSDEKVALGPPGRIAAPSEIDPAGAYQDAVERLLASFRALPATATVRLAKRTSNLFRQRSRTRAPGLDVSGLTGVLSIDADARTADVAGMCTYEDLVAATLPFGLSPLVVPQLKTITVGGALTGLGHRVGVVPKRPGSRIRPRVRRTHRIRRPHHRDTGRSACRPVLRLPELVREPGVRNPGAHRARGGEVLRRAPPLEVFLHDRAAGCAGDHRGDRFPRRRPSRLPRRGGVLSRRELPDAGHPDRCTGSGQ